MMRSLLNGIFVITLVIMLLTMILYIFIDFKIVQNLTRYREDNDFNVKERKRLIQDIS